MAFTAKILSWRFRHLNPCRLFAQKKSYQGEGGGGGSQAQDPPSYAPGVRFVFIPKVLGDLF